MPTQEDRPITPSPSLSNSQSSPEDHQPVLHIWGKQPLSGHVTISGAKNSALVLMAGSILCSGTCRLRNVPSLLDITRIGEILSALGVKVSHSQGILDLDASEITQSKAPYDIVSKLRASFFVAGPLLARLGVAQVPLPGGCSIGDRPVDLHVKGLQALGAEVIIEHGVVNAHVRGNRKRLTGARIYLDFPSVGATENIMMAATLAEGETIIENAAQEPEVVDLANFCRAMGAQIRGAGTNRIVINGVEKLHEVDYSVVPDRIEAGTFLLAGAITRSEISLSPVVPDHLSAAIAKLHEIGVKVAIDAPDTVRVLPAGSFRGTDIETLPFPGFPTDLQAPFMSLLTLADGDSVITETLFENRLQHVAELNRMGADIRLKGNIAIVRGVPQLSGAPVQGTDLRASAALVIAGLAANGMTTVRGLNHLDRGYDNIEAKLRGLGAKIERGQEDAVLTAPVESKMVG
ncbi:UDP-N-acetylglucosamine 1-carboxyvinyltransferase [Leptolyngbya sp. NIES-2104]|uniref:UDP-N-acetylglucosamine 1-carboxyvinyltransferase n=1 Tax=Leptolyngbya sp. NIES-2104 TaxID=1552121 RepID=UPI00073E7A9D|nr:UDP-N-acetylglucosamine 1-carboxyvinyltransferase [Leptolyngbya sp. NIES-2104]